MEHQLVVATQVAQEIGLDLIAGLILPPGGRLILFGLFLIILLGMARIPMFITELWTRQKFKKQLQESRRSK